MDAKEYAVLFESVANLQGDDFEEAIVLTILAGRKWCSTMKDGATEQELVEIREWIKEIQINCGLICSILRCQVAVTYDKEIAFAMTSKGKDKVEATMVG